MDGRRQHSSLTAPTLKWFFFLSFSFFFFLFLSFSFFFFPFYLLCFVLSRLRDALNRTGLFNAHTIQWSFFGVVFSLCANTKTIYYCIWSGIKTIEMSQLDSEQNYNCTFKFGLLLCFLSVSITL